MPQLPSRKLSSVLILRVFLPLAVVALLLLAYRFFWLGSAPSLVVYCSHDSIYAQSVLDRFQSQTGIPVVVRYDAEDTKSLSLLEQIIREKDSPRCDVFWNNELLGTVDLADRGILLPYQGPGFRRIPDNFKDPEGRWVGFAARLRVVIVNTDKMRPDPAALSTALAGDLSRMAVAKPLYGTTFTHYTVLADLWGLDRLKAWHADLLRRGVKFVNGNAAVRSSVASGVCDFGFTDTDDFFSALDEHKPVAMLPVLLDDGRTILIPNTVSIIRGSRRLDAARQLVDYLLSQEVELSLANSSSRQIPLGPLPPDAALSPEVRALLPWVSKAYPLVPLVQPRKSCLAWLKSEIVE